MKQLLASFAILMIIPPLTIGAASCPPPVVPPAVDASVDAPPPNVVDASSATDGAPTCVNACAQLKAVGCPEGKASNCVDALCAVNASPKFQHYSLSCLVQANTKTLVQMCGVACDGG